MMESSETLKNPSLIPGGGNISKWPWWAIVLILTALAVSYLILNPTSQLILVPANSANTYDNFRTNSNLKIGIVSNSTSETVAKNKFKNEQIQSYNDLEALIQALTVGTVDAALLDNASASDYTGKDVGKYKVATRIPSNYHDTFMYLLRGNPVPGQPAQGVVVTLRITVISFLSATFLGLFAGLSRVSKNVFLYNVSTLYVEVVRGIPLVVLLLYVAFALFPLFVDLIQGIGSWGLTLLPGSGFFQSFNDFTIRGISMEGRAIIALAFGYGAYEAEVFRSGIQSIGKGQMEAAKSLGMSYIQGMRFIVLPQAIRRVLPPLGNDFIACLKDSSLATVLAVNELTQLGRMLRASTFRVLETFNVMAFLYLFMTLLLSSFVRWLEHKMKIEE
jgi:polar amino acid transport system permease protein